MLQQLLDSINKLKCVIAGLSKRIATITAQNVVTSASTYALPTQTTYVTFTGTTSTWTLPPVTGNTGIRLILINSGSGAVTLNSNAGGNDINDSGVLKSTLSIGTSEIYVLYDNGLKYVIIP